MNLLRRSLVKRTALLGSLPVLGMAARSQAVERNVKAHQAKTAEQALKLLGISGTTASPVLRVELPDVADNGGAVPLEITSGIPGTRSVYVLVDENPFPYAARFDFREGAAAYVKVNFKMQESSTVRVIAEAGGRHYAVTRKVRVTVGGCGG